MADSELRLQPPASRPAVLPDIYYIILDAHTSFPSLKKYWGYQDDGFSRYLQARGFFLADRSRSNYDFTYFSLAASLNMDYVAPWPLPKNLELSLQAFYGSHLIKQSRVVELLRAQGYEIVNLSLFDLPGQPRWYSFSFSLPELVSVPRTFFESTMLFVIYKFFYFHSHLKAINQTIIEQLREIPSQPGPRPRFVYAHLMMPHFPYIFDAQGNVADWKALGISRDQDKYLQQLIYTDKMVMELVDGILRKSPVTPIIILQGDHGYRWLDVKEKFTILNAYLLPQAAKELLYPTISPVNTFRVFFNGCFGTRWQLLPDQSLDHGTAASVID